MTDGWITLEYHDWTGCRTLTGPRTIKREHYRGTEADLHRLLAANAQSPIHAEPVNDHGLILWEFIIDRGKHLHLAGRFKPRDHYAPAGQAYLDTLPAA